VTKHAVCCQHAISFLCVLKMGGAGLYASFPALFILIYQCHNDPTPDENSSPRNRAPQPIAVFDVKDPDQEV